jgi:hypothetical protein
MPRPLLVGQVGRVSLGQRTLHSVQEMRTYGFASAAVLPADQAVRHTINFQSTL